MGFFSYILNINKRNADPIQQKMAQMIIDVVEDRQHPVEIIRFVQSQGWGRSDQIERLTHALSMVRVFRADLYPQAQEIYRQVDAILKAT
jgi:hypothetical protein